MNLIVNSFWKENGYEDKLKYIENNILFMAKVLVLSTSCHEYMSTEYIRVFQDVYSCTMSTSILVHGLLH